MPRGPLPYCGRLFPETFLGWAPAACPSGTSHRDSVQLTSRDRNFISSRFPGLEKPGQGSGGERGFEGRLSLGEASSHSSGRAFHLFPYLLTPL